MGILTVLNLILGMIFIYFLMSLICNSVFEAISAMCNLRSHFLTMWLKETLPGIAPNLLDTPLLNGLSDKGDATSYISAPNFSLAIMNVFASYWKKVPANAQEISQALDDFNTAEYIPKGAANLLPKDFQNMLRIFATQAQSSSANPGDQLKDFTKSIETWFDSMMDRVSGVYKRWSMFCAGVVALLFTVAANLDSIDMVKYLIGNPAAAQKLADAGTAAASDTALSQTVAHISKQNATETTVTTIDSTGKMKGTVITQVKSNIDQANNYKNQLATYIPMGWKCGALPKGLGGWLSKIAGLLITIFAVSLGAPFWYDLLCKVANLRSSIKPATTASSDDDKKQKTSS